MAGATYVGKVKSWNPDKGWGHVECPETRQLYGKDVFLLRSRLIGTTSLSAGDKICFSVVDTSRGPEAADVQVFEGMDMISMGDMGGITGGTAGDMGGTAGGMGGLGDMGGAAGGMSDLTPSLAPGKAYYGIVKSWNPVKGWGHITCDHVTTLYGKDMFFMRSQMPNGTAAKGMHVRFEIVQGKLGPEAANIHVITQGGTPQTQVSPPVPTSVQTALTRRASPPVPTSVHTALTRRASPPVPTSVHTALAKGAHEHVYYGSIKSYQEEKGWGHIECPQTHAIYQKDMFFLRSALNGLTANVGDKVQFCVTAGKKGLEASNVRVVSTGKEIYVGTIKQYNAEKGYGFILCDDTWTIFGKDIFVHYKDLDGAVPSQGEPVQFTVEITGAGRPQAANVLFNVIPGPSGKGKTARPTRSGPYH